VIKLNIFKERKNSKPIDCMYNISLIKIKKGGLNYVLVKNTRGLYLVNLKDSKVYPIYEHFCI
jgi:hypothetical protein